MKITNHENSSKVIVIHFDEDKPLVSVMPGHTHEGDVKLLVLPKHGRVRLSVEPSDEVTP